MIPTPTEIYLPDWHKAFKEKKPERFQGPWSPEIVQRRKSGSYQLKGAEGPGYYDLALGLEGEGLPSQELTDEYIRHLLREGFKDGGKVGDFDAKVDRLIEKHHFDNHINNRIEEHFAKGGMPKLARTSLRMAGGGLLGKGAKALAGAMKGEDLTSQAIGKAAESAGMKAPVTANKPLTNLQDVYTSLGDRVNQGAVEMQNLIESMPYKYDKGQRVFTADSVKKNKPPYTILRRVPYGNQPMREDHPNLQPGNKIGKPIIDPATGKTQRTPYEPGYHVRHDGDDGWTEFQIPESAIKGDVEMARGGSVLKHTTLRNRGATQAHPNGFKDGGVTLAQTSLRMAGGGDPLDEFVPPRYRSAGRRPESQNDREASANMPVDFARGVVSGIGGTPGDIESLIRMIPGLERSRTLSDLVTGNHRETYLPTSEEIEKRLPFKSDTPAGRAASGLGTLVGGFYSGPGAPIRLVGGLPKAVYKAGKDFARASGQPATRLDVYHGSPYKFDAFDASKIGTGEGAQAYGHGIYTAENPGTAQGYQATLGHKGALDLEHEAIQRGIPLSREAKVELMRQSMRDVSPKMAVKNLQNASIDARNLDPDKLAALVKDYMESKQGSFYKVDLPDKKIAKMLDWDKPLSEQPDVIKALKGTDYEVGISQKEAEKIADMRLRQEADEWAEMTGGDPVDYSNNVDWEKYVDQVRKESGNIDSGITGKDLHRMVMRDEGYRPDLFDSENYQVGTSEALRGMGIPGIKYLDANSRDAGKGTRNFVTFPGEEQSMTILERNGQPMVAPTLELKKARGGAILKHTTLRNRRANQRVR